MEGGNSLEQAVALVAAANKVVQDPNSVGSALRTISLRIRGTSVEVLEELGEETDGVVESTSKLQKQVKALTGVDILTDSGAYKDTYTILKEIGSVWQDMESLDQAATLELLAGKNRANTLAAILNNMQDLEGAYFDALNAEGSAIKENEAYLDSIQGRIDLFTNSVQTMWMNFINDDVVKFLVDIGRHLVNLVDKFGAVETILVGYMGYLTFIKKMDWKKVSDSIIGIFKKDKSSGILGGEALEQEIAAMNQAASKGKEAFDEYVNSSISARNGVQLYAKQLNGATATVEGYTNAMKNASEAELKQMRSLNDAAKAQTKHNIIMMAASTAFTILGSMIKKLIDGNESLSESYEKLQSSISTLTSDLDSLGSELESVQDRINELSGKELTLTEAEELQALKEQSAELERQIGLKETLLDGREQQNQVTTLAKINEMLKTTAEGQVDAVEKAKTWGYWLGKVADTALIIGGIAVSGMSFGAAVPVGAAMIGAGSSGIASELAEFGAGAIANKTADTENGTLIEWYESYKDAIEKAQMEASSAENKYLQTLNDEDYETWQKKVSKLSSLQTDLYDGLEELQGYMSNLEYNDVTGPIIDAYNDMMAQIEVENVGDGVQSRIDAIKALEAEYNTLSKGLDQNGNNVALSSEEYSRYQSIVKQLIAYSPDLIQGYDAEGNAILNRNNLIDDGIKLIQEQQQAEAKAMIESKKLSETYKSLQDAKNNKIDSVKDTKTDTLGNLNANIRKGEISNILGIELDPNANLSEYIVNNADAVRENIDAILESASKSLSIEELATYKAYLNDIFAQLDNIDAELSDGIRSSLYNVPMASDYYYELEGSHISFINSYINSLGDLSDVTDAEFAQIANSMLALTDTIGANENIQQLVENLFTINPDIPAKIYEDTLNQALQELINHGIASEDMKEALLAELFPDKSNVDTMSNFIRQKLNDAYDKAIDGLSIAELKIAYRFVADAEDGSLEWSDIEEQLAKEIEIKSVSAYSTLSESVSKYQEVLKQASEVTTDGTLITQELREELISLGVTEEDLSECFSENNKLLVENADAFNEVVKSAKETAASNIEIAKSRAQLKYNDLIDELKIATQSYEGFTEETHDTTNAIIDQIGTIKQSINQYQQLEDTLLGTTSAFDKFAKAQEIDSQNAYGESYVTMAQTMYDAIYKTGEVGSAQFWSAVEATVPDDIYAHLLPGRDQINAIVDYLNNNVFSVLTLSGDSFSIDYSAIEDFILKAQEVGVFTGKDASSFGLSQEFIYNLEEDENALKAFADRMGMTVTQVYTYLSEMDKYNANGFGLSALLQLDNSTAGQITNVNNELEQLYIRRKALIEQRAKMESAGEDTTDIQLQLEGNWKDIAKYEAQLTDLHNKATITVEEFAKIDNVMLKIGDIDDMSIEEMNEIIPDEIETQLALTGDETVEEVYQKLIDYRSQFEEPTVMEIDIAQDQIDEELDSLIEQFSEAELEANVVVDENGLREIKNGKLTIDADVLERYIELKNANLFIDNSLVDGLTTSEQYLSRIADNTDIMAGKDNNSSNTKDDKGGDGSTNGGGTGFNGNPTPPAELVPNTFEYWEIKKQLDKVANDYYSETGGGGAGVYGQPYDPYNPENIEYEVENLNDATQETTKSTEVLLKQYDILLDSLSGIDSAVLIQPNELNSLGFGTITTEAIGAADAIEIVRQKKDALVKSEETGSLIDIVNVEKGILTYSELQNKISSFNDVLAQTDEIIENDTEVSQEYIDSLKSLCETQEEINEIEEAYYVKNGKLIVKNAAMIKKLVAQKKQDQKATIKQAKSGAQLQYKNTVQQLQTLIKAMALEIKATGLVSSATMNNIDVLRDQIDAIKKTIQQYALLEVSLSDAANAYSEFESAKERDAQLSYDDSMLEMIQVLNDGFKTGKVGTEAFQFAVEAIVPYEVYGHIDDLEQRMIAIHDYVDKNPLFADWFTVDEGEFSITFDNITNFIKDGIDNGIFTGTVEDFELGDISSIEEMAAAFGQTEAVILAMLSAMEDYDASWGNIISDITTHPLDREIIKATDALDEALIAQENFIKSGGDLNSEEYKELVANVESAQTALEDATKEAENYTAQYANIQTAYAALTGQIKLTKDAAENLFKTLGFVDENGNVTIEVDDDGTIHITQQQLDILNGKAEELKKEPTLMRVQLQYDTIDAEIAELQHYIDNKLDLSKSDVAIKYNITNQKEAEDEIARLTAVQKTISLTYGITTTSSEQSTGTIEKLTTWETNGLNINITGNTEQLQSAVQTANALSVNDKEVLITADPTQANSAIDSVDNNNIEDKEPVIYVQGVPVAISKIDSVSDALDKLKDETIKITVNKTTYEKTKKWNSKTQAWESIADGTAHANGTANADGNWGAPKTETSLVGELGPEILVRNGKWTTVGENGAEFTQVRKGDIIFNHKQTQDLLSKGYVTGRGKIKGGAFASGTMGDSGTAYYGAVGPYVGDEDVFKNGSNKWMDPYANASSAISDAANSLSDAADEFSEIFDWIEIRLEEINESISLSSAKLENAIGFDKQNKVIDEMIELNQALYNNLIAGANKYYDYAKKLLNKVPSAYRQAAQDGTIAIEEFVGEVDEKTLTAIQEYREWVQKGADATQQAEETLTEISSLAKQAIDNISQDFENKASLNDNKINQLEAYNALLETDQGFESEKIYQELIKINNANIEQLKKQRKEMQAELDAQVKAGNIKKYSQDWYDAVNAIAEVDTEIIELTTDTENYQDAINELHWDKFDALVGHLEAVSNETENLIDILSSKDLVDEIGNWTDEGITTLGLYAQQMEVAEVQAKKYQEEIAYLNENWQKLGYTEEEYIEKLEDLKDGQFDAIKAYHDSKNAIVDLNKERIDSVKNAIEKEIKAYEKLIDAKQEELNAEKD